MATGQYSIPYGRSRADAIYTDAMARMYGLVALGVVTAAAAIWVGDVLGSVDISDMSVIHTPPAAGFPLSLEGEG